ncbi:hypothetical protein [Streptomyces sp. Y1]|uniref:Uncharacterized protein n=1 Tax=Streptomyces sp. Y1 TaxID=3238634 RepID=A0AB39TM30_9ACTN
MSMLANLVPAMRHPRKRTKTGKETRTSKTADRRRRRGTHSRH